MTLHGESSAAMTVTLSSLLSSVVAGVAVTAADDDDDDVDVDVDVTLV
jgi:hypothetical protein